MGEEREQLVSGDEAFDLSRREDIGDGGFRAYLARLSRLELVPTRQKPDVRDSLGGCKRLFAERFRDAFRVDETVVRLAEGGPELGCDDGFQQSVRFVVVGDDGGQEAPDEIAFAGTGSQQVWRLGPWKLVWKHDRNNSMAPCFAGLGDRLADRASVVN